MFKRLAIALFAALALVAPTAAADTGTPAWLINGQSLYEGPGAAYDVVGDLGDETRIRVLRCNARWCLIRAEGSRGWASRDNISFGQHPRGPLTGPRLEYGSGAVVCLYSGRNFSGDRTCVPPGTVVHDLLLWDADNRISSVEVNGGSVTLCRDRDFTSYCEKIVEDQASLHGFLDDNVSSYRVW
jgi:uncharacterized protein YraI